VKDRVIFVELPGIVLDPVPPGTRPPAGWQFEYGPTTVVAVDGPCRLLKVSNTGANPVSVFDCADARKPHNRVAIVGVCAVSDIDFPMSHGVTVSGISSCAVCYVERA
jgi:hypothetical protein